MNSGIFYFYPDQDTSKSHSPVLEHPREGFDDESRQDEVKPVKKKSPFAVTNEDPLPVGKQKTKKVKKDSTDKSDVSEKKKPEKAIVIRVKEDEKSSGKKKEMDKESEPSPKTEDTNEKVLKAEPEKEVVQKPVEDTIVKKTKTVVIQKVNTLIPKVRNYENQDGVFLLLILVAFLFGWINVFHRRRFAQVINAVFISRYINQLIREENALLQRVFVMVSVTFILILSIFAFQASHFYGLKSLDLETMVIFLICALGVSIIYFTKLISLNIVGYLFKAERVVKEYFYNLLLINNLTGILLMPIILAIAYVPQINQSALVISGVGVYLSSILYRLFRGLSIGWNTGTYSIFHIFIYLCTLEILPLIVMIKILMLIF